MPTVKSHPRRTKHGVTTVRQHLRRKPEYDRAMSALKEKLVGIERDDRKIASLQM